MYKRQLFNNITEVFPTNEKRKVILDVDTGSDDAVAIMAAVCAPELEVLGVCSVAGNQPIDNTTENTLRVMQLLGSDIPVYRGASGPVSYTHLDVYKRQISPMSGSRVTTSTPRMNGATALPWPQRNNIKIRACNSYQSGI